MFHFLLLVVAVSSAPADQPAKGPVELTRILENDINPYGEQWWQLIGLQPGGTTSLSDVDERGFHENVFGETYEDFRPVFRTGTQNRNRRKTRWPNKNDKTGFSGGAFHSNFGQFRTMKRDRLKRSTENTANQLPDRIYWPRGKRNKRELNQVMGAKGFNRNTFKEGFGDFHVMKKRQMNARGFNGNTFSSGFGSFDVMKRRPEMDSSGFAGDTFSNGFGSFDIMKRPLNEEEEALIYLLEKRLAETNTFGRNSLRGSFGDGFSTMKRRPEMTASGFAGDSFSSGFGEFHPMKRRPEMTASGFAGDAFSSGFGDFHTMKRAPKSGEMSSNESKQAA